MALPVHPYSDYGVALRTLRGARNKLGILLAACAFMQIVGFLLVRYSTQPYVAMRPQFSTVAPTKPRTAPPVKKNAARRPPGGAVVSNRQAAVNPVPRATRPAAGIAMPPNQLVIRTAQGKKLDVRGQWDTTYFLLVPLTQLLGLVSAASQSIIIFITLLLILVAQAPGVAYATRSLIWSVLLLFMVLPWQYFAANFPIPGVLYGYAELLRAVAPFVVRPRPHPIYLYQQALLIARFIVWPMMALVVMILTGERFRAGMRLAIGHPMQSLMQQGSPAGSAPRPETRTMSPLPPLPPLAPLPPIQMNPIGKKTG